MERQQCIVLLSYMVCWWATWCAGGLDDVYWWATWCVGELHVICGWATCVLVSYMCVELPGVCWWATCCVLVSYMVCVSELHGTVNNTQILSASQPYSYCKLISPTTMLLGLHVKFPIFLSDFNQIWSFLTVFHRDPDYQMSRKSVQCESPLIMQKEGLIRDRRTDRRDEANRRFSRVCECT
jgi:hypothetical protein